MAESEIDHESNQEASGYLASAGTDWVRIQRSTFTNWCNEHLKKSQRSIKHLASDLKDGVILIQLIESLSKKSPPRYNKNPRIKQQMLENLIAALDFITAQGIRLVNIGNEDIYNGQEKLILGLVWGLISHYQIKTRKTKQASGGGKGSSAKDAMKDWLREVLPGKNIRNFTRDWNDGRLLLSLVDAMQPGIVKSSVPDDPLERCRYAIDLAEENFQIPKLLEAEDLCNPAVDELSVMTYLSYFVSMGDIEDTGDVDQLLDWVHDQLPSCTLTNFDSDWHSGIALVGLVESISPGAFPDWMDLNPNNGEENFQLGIDLARQHLDVDLELAAEELVTSGVGNDLGFMPLIAELQTATQEIEFARNCFAFGDGLIEAIVNNKAEFNVQHQSRVSHINVEIVTADRKPVTGQVTAGATSNELVIGYTPLVAGECKVQVLCCGRNIPNSPFTVDVQPEPDPSSCRVTGSGIGTVIVNTKQEFTIDTQNAGQGQLKVLLQDVKSTPASIEEVPGKSGVYKVSYTPLEVGKLEVLILLGGKLIDNIPTSVLVLDPTKVLLNGEGLRTACQGQRTVFTADTRQAGPGELQVKFGLGQTASGAKTEASREEEQIYIVEYEPQKLGKMTVDVKWSGLAIPSGNFTVSVVKAGYTGAVSLDTDKIELGEVVNLTARLQGGKQSSGGKLTAKARGLKSGPTPVQVKVGADDRFHIEMKPDKADEYFIDIFYDDVPIAGSPLRAVFANPCHPELVVAHGPSMGSVGRKIEYVVDTSQAGGGDLEVYVSGPAHGEMFVTVEQGDTPTLHNLIYTPDAEGQHSMDIKWAGTAVPGSPFKLDITRQTVDASKVRVHYDADAMSQLLLGDPFVMAFDISETGHDEFSAMAVADSSSESIGIDVMQQDEDVYTLTYDTTTPGDYALYIFYGENQIEGSPFPLRVVTGPGEIEVEGIRFGDVGDPVLLSIRLTDLSKQKSLSITAQSPEDLEPEVVTEIDKQDDGTLLAQYMPTTSGQHHFEILWRSGHIVDGSFDIEVTPARQASSVVARAKVGGPSNSPQRPSRRRSGVANLVKNTFSEAVVGENVSASIQAPGTALENVSGSVTGPDGKVSAAEVLTNTMGTFTILVRPEKPGKHELVITISGRPVNGSPFFFQAEPTSTSKGAKRSIAGNVTTGNASQCTVSKVPQDVMVGTACRFIVDSRIAGSGDLSVTVASGPLRQTDISISRLRDKVFSVQLAPWVPGEVQLNVHWAGKPVPSSPISIAFLDCTPDAGKCKANTESPLQVATNRWQRVLVNTEGAGRGTLTAVLKSKSYEAPLLIERQARFLYRCSFLTQTPGSYSLIVKWSGEHIPGSPFTVNSVHKCYPDKIKVIHLKTGKVGAASVLAVDTSEAGIGVLAVKALDPSGKDIEVSLKKAKDAERKVMAEFVPRMAGRYQVNIKWSRVLVPNSPFLIQVV
eukprot:scpid12801/ scgid33135/ Filamin-A; Actin-binding protein 280; Alpha-filamin; Endothelial actin-binding protein; Filamin-1; Non-muscle filamin